jgi:3-isopropylmalate dehydrogenase
MPANRKLLVLAGDGIGPEAMRQVLRVVDWFDKRRAVRFEVTEDLVGGAAIDKHGTPLTDDTMAPSAGRNGTTSPSPRSRSAGSCA